MSQILCEPTSNGVPIMAAKLRIRTSDHRRARALWIMAGGTIEPVRRTGEVRYRHAFFTNVLTINGRRSDTPAVVLHHLNILVRAGFLPN
jgi:hypothetical protein